MFKRIALLAVLVGLLIAALPAASQAASVNKISVPLTPICKVSPSVRARPAGPSISALQAFCRHHGKPVPVKAHSTQILCIGAGCSWLHFFNLGGGWAYAEWGADPYGWTGGIWYGAAAIQRFRKQDGNTSYITDKVTPNCGGGFDYCGERYQYPIKVGCCISPGWVADTFYGWTYLRDGLYAQIGPVVAWNYIT